MRMMSRLQRPYRFCSCCNGPRTRGQQRQREKRSWKTEAAEQ